MAKWIFEHNKYWIRKLTSPYVGIIDQEIIDKHVETCPECARIIAEKERLDQLIHALPAPDFPEGLSPRLLQLWEAEDRNESLAPLSDKVISDMKDLYGTESYRKTPTKNFNVIHKQTPEEFDEMAKRYKREALERRYKAAEESEKEVDKSITNL